MGVSFDSLFSKVLITFEWGQTNSRPLVEPGNKVQKREVLAKVPRIINQSRNITGGLPRVVELFEARRLANTSIISEFSGVVSYGGIKRGNREIFIESKEGMQVKNGTG